MGPDYHRPPVETAANFKEAGDWKPSEPNDVMSRGPWWKIFNDEALNRARSANRHLESKRQSRRGRLRAVASPGLSGARRLLADHRREPIRAARPGGCACGHQQRRESALELAQRRAEPPTAAGVSASWDIDIWGQIRRTVESDRSLRGIQFGGARGGTPVGARRELATDYFELRAQDQLEKLLDDTVVAETLSLKITQSRYKFGVAARADVVSAETQLLSSQAQQVNAKIQRAILEHAIAVLVGKQPAEFSLQASAMRTDVPTVPPGVPSTLLERRPDVAEAERKMAAANAQIGVAKAAYFPGPDLERLR